MGYRFDTTVRFSQVDGASILYFSRAHEICHEAFEAFLAHLGQPLHDRISTGEWMLPIVHAEVDFASPMRLGDRLTVEVAVQRYGTTSVTVRFRLFGEDGALRAVARHVHVAVRTGTMQPIPLPRPVREWGVADDG
ncbi:MAG: acyl-CoA thioesterase [Myxococcales bacterium]|nr:acyl-CoA thioesterase [Myxococcales bacterium]